MQQLQRRKDVSARQAELRKSFQSNLSSQRATNNQQNHLAGVKGVQDPIIGSEGKQRGSTIDKIISLEQELKMLNDENMNPKDIYLQHCLQFAKSNFDQMKITVEEYKIKPKDVQDKIFFKESQTSAEDGDDNASNTNDIFKSAIDRAEVDQNKKISDEYDILDIKMFPEVFIVNGKQQIIVKTWELIEKRKQGGQ